MRGLPNYLRVLAALAACAAACGDDDGGDGNAGIRDGGPTVPDGGGAEGTDGWPCTREDECVDELRCNGSPITINNVPIGVCGAPCSDDDECGGGLCLSYTDDEADAHCVDIVTDEYELCGVADTSVCSPDLACLYLPNRPFGVCVRLCALDGAASGEDDAGVPAGGCSAGHTCIDGVLADPEPGEGVCGMRVERGGECGLGRGLYCNEGDVCGAEAPGDPNSDYRCYQDCSSGQRCEQGVCTVVRGDGYAYCAP